MIIEKGVAKNVSAGTATGACAATTTRDPAGIRAVLRSLAGPLSAILCATALCVAPLAARARGDSGLGEPISFSSLPREAQQTERLVHSGGPFPYSKDGVVFANRESRLERQPRGYYHEYTVPTPDARTRGARRIVCGGTARTEPDACFYTEDHYNSFHRIVK